MVRTRFHPPQINEIWLIGQTLKQYPGHNESKHMVEILVKEYLKLWRLFLSYPEKRIVGPGPIIAIQRVHWEHRKQYFYDCMDYFNKYLFKELVWQGRTDIKGSLDTVRAYQDLYNEDPPSSWCDLLHVYHLGHSDLHLV